MYVTGEILYHYISRFYIVILYHYADSRQSFYGIKINLIIGYGTVNFLLYQKHA